MALILFEQIRAEMTYHNIRLYPFDSEENDEEEVQLNQSIRVRCTTYPPNSAMSQLTRVCRT